jgi:hypothetical protein
MASPLISASFSDPSVRQRATTAPASRSGKSSSIQVNGLAAGSMLTPPPTSRRGAPVRPISAMAGSSFGVKWVR